MKHINKLKNRFAAFTLIELLVVISIIAILAGLTLQNLPGIIAKGQITGVLGGYHNLFIANQNANLDAQNSGAAGAFPGDLGGTITAWSNALVPTYMAANSFTASLSIKGNSSNSTVYSVGATNDPMSVLVSCANLGSNSVGSGAPFGKYGGAFLNLSGSAISVNGTNSNALAQTTNAVWVATKCSP